MEPARVLKLSLPAAGLLKRRTVGTVSEFPTGPEQFRLLCSEVLEVPLSSSCRVTWLNPDGDKPSITSLGDLHIINTI